MKIRILQPHGFCAGVTAAIRRAHTLAETCKDETIYCLHELVHNELVVSDLKAKGFKFVDSIDEIPEGSVVLFSAHGVSPLIRTQADGKGLRVADATCPFVARVHKAAADFNARGLKVVIIGHPNHVEVKGILGEAPHAMVIEPNSQKAAVFPAESFRQCCSEKSVVGIVSQTTLNADEVSSTVELLRSRFEIETVAQVCNATKERQDAIKAFDGDGLLVLGSLNSSNTNRLCEIAKCRVFRAGTMDEVRSLDFDGINVLGVTSGASTPEDYYEEAIAYLRMRFEKEN